jgi:hypothetical protein
MFKQIIVLLVAIVAFAAAFAPAPRFGARQSCLNSCNEKQKDKNGRCPGESGYVSFTKEDPGDWAVSLSTVHCHTML